MTAPSGISGMNYTDLQGRTVYGNDGSKLGKVADLYDDDSGGAPIFATVNTGLFGSKTTFVPMTQAQLQGDDVVVPYSKDQVKGAPSIEADAEVSPQEEQEIFSYYGLGGGGGQGQAGTQGQAGAQGTSGSAAGATDRDGDGIPDAQERGSAAGNQHGTIGHDTSGPTTDQAMTRSEEQLRVGTQQV